MSAPPRALDAAAARTLRARLGELGYDDAGCARALGLPGPERLVLRVQAWRMVGPRAHFQPRTGEGAAPLDVLLALLLFGETVPRETVAGAAGTDTVSLLVETGVALEQGASLRSAVMMFPCQGLHLVTDRADADAALNPVMPLFPESYDLGRIAVRAPVERSLDVCTGSGIHALLAARHAREAVGVDISPRALAFSRFNAWLNAIDNVAWLEGDVYAPLPAGARYGLVTANPPYNPELRSAAGDDYHSGGESGEEILERIVAGVPERLEQDGCAHVITLLIHREGDELEPRLARWLGPPGSGAWDVLLLAKPVDYKPLVLKGGPLSPADQALHESWKRQRITRFEFGVVNVRHARAARETRVMRGPSHESAEAGDVPARFAEVGLDHD
jgi:SAM-dependent methyltransferase